MGSTVPLLQTLPSLSKVISELFPFLWVFNISQSFPSKQLYCRATQIKTPGVALKHLIAKSANITAPFFLICLSKGFSSREVDIGRSHIQPRASALAGPSQLN